MGKKNKQKKKQSLEKNEDLKETTNETIESTSEEKETEINETNVNLDNEEPIIDNEDDEYEAEVRAYQDVLAEKGKSFTTEEQDDEDSSENETNRETRLALKQRLEEIQPNLPFMETLNITSTTPLPFQSTKDLIHDDLKREVIFYNTALEAVSLAKEEFSKNNVPFTRPQDFYAEMVKTDDHMRKVKDRLLFESKKIAAFESRKMNRENKLRSKENKNKAMEMKNRGKREHFDALKNWEKDRSGGDDDENKFKRYFDGKNPRRIAADRRYGHGGPAKKKGHFKQADKKALNDFSEFKKNNKKGDKRPGKRAREAKRQRRN